MIVDSNEFMTGIEEIDEQHKHYVDLVNRLVASHNAKKDDMALLQNCVNEIVAYAMEHFDAEERLMRSLSYPLYEQHAEKHKIFRSRADDFLVEITETTPKEIYVNSYVERLLKWLIDWFKQQVLYDDSKLAMFIKGKNLSSKK